MATTVKVQDLSALGAIAVGDNLLGERVAGQTRKITYTPKTMTGTTNQITVVNGNQVSGDPTFSISTGYVGQTSITTLGTITTGTWNATTLGVTYGGTGLSSTTINQLLYSSANNTIAGLATANNGVLVTGASGIPAISTDIPAAVTSGGQYIYRVGGTDVALADGGMNASLTASDGGIFYSTASAGAILSGTATANKMLLSGSSTAPTWSTSTIPTSAGATALKHLRSDGTNYVLSTATYSDTPSTAGKIMVSDGTNWITSTPTFPNSSATNRKIIVSDGTNWVASTETYPTPGTSGNIMTSNGTNWVSSTASVTGKPIIQTVFTTTGTMATGTTIMPLDNTTPQNTEGDEYMTLAITPTNASNILEIEMVAQIATSVAESMLFAMFQDSTANCLKSGFVFAGGSGGAVQVILRHRMVAGTTSATTFKFRAGRSATGTMTFNGYLGTSYLNGTMSSHIKITEHTV